MIHKIEINICQHDDEDGAHVEIGIRLGDESALTVFRSWMNPDSVGARVHYANKLFEDVVGEKLDALVRDALRKVCEG